MRTGRVLGLLVTGVAVCASAARGQSPEATSSGWRSPRYVVSYLVSASRDTSVEAPDEDLPDRKLSAHPWQWRVFDPASGRDTLLLALPFFPTRVRWDHDFRSVEYALDGRIERAEWRIGARPQVQVSLPLDSALCDFWMDGDGRWHVTTEREVETRLSPGSVRSITYATRWDQEGGGRWRAAAVDSGGDAFGGCFDSEHLVGGPRLAMVTVKALLDSMRIECRPYSTISERDTADLESWVWVPSVLDTSIGLEMGEWFGDTDHAKEPVVWVDRKYRRRRATVYARGDSHDDALGQLAFAQRGRYLLVAAEYSGAYPAVADMRTGRVVFRVSRPSARAVWVPTPR
jgi:hypothetical protein